MSITGIHIIDKCPKYSLRSKNILKIINLKIFFMNVLFCVIVYESNFVFRKNVLVNRK